MKQLRSRRCHNNLIAFRGYRKTNNESNCNNCTNILLC